MAFSGCTIGAAGDFCVVTSCNEFSMAHGGLLAPVRTVNATNQASKKQRKGECARNDDCVIKDLNKHVGYPLLIIFFIVVLYAFIGVLYIDKSAKVGGFVLCVFVHMSCVYV